MVIETGKESENYLVVTEGNWHFQELLSNFWPAKYQYMVNGWIVRIADGQTGRANSVLPNNYHGKSLENDLTTVEQIYGSFGYKTIFQITDDSKPGNVSEILVSRKYTQYDLTNVMVGKLEPWLKLEMNGNYGYRDARSHVEWFDTAQNLTNSSHVRIEEKKGVYQRIRIPEKALMTAIDDKNNIIGVVMCVADKEYLCVFDLVVHQHYRNQGIATSLMAHAASWAVNKGISSVFLQVEAINQAAINLYEKLGLQKLYSYCYYAKEV